MLNQDLKPLYTLLVNLRKYRAGYRMNTRPDGSGTLYLKKNASCLLCKNDLVFTWDTIEQGINLLTEETKKYGSLL